MPWYAVFLGYPVIGIWYWCTDQTIVQRVLGAKDENHARVGPPFAGFIKILSVFILVLPGLMCYVLVRQGYSGFGGESPATGADTYAFMITNPKLLDVTESLCGVRARKLGGQQKGWPLDA